MSRMLASAIAMFAASLLVLASAVMLAFGPGSKKEAAPMPAVLDQIQPQAGQIQAGQAALPAVAGRQGRIGSDMTATIRAMEARAEAEAGPKPAPAAPGTEAPVDKSPTASAKAPEPPPAKKPANVPAPPPSAWTQPTAPLPAAPAAQAEATADAASRSGSGPINLVPRRSGTAPGPAAAPSAAPAAGVTAVPPSTYTAAMPPAAAPAPASGPIFIPLADDEANLTADQLNERELQRIRKWREGEAARGAAAQ